MSSIDPMMLEILVCPETKQPVALADQELIKKLNAAREGAELKTRGGKTVEEPIQEGLVRADGKYFYNIVDQIPVMLIDEAICLDGLGGL